MAALDFMAAEGFATWPQIYILAAFSVAWLVSVVMILLSKGEADGDEPEAPTGQLLHVFGANFTSCGAAPAPMKKKVLAAPEPAPRAVEAEAPAPSPEPEEAAEQEPPEEEAPAAAPAPAPAEAEEAAPEAPEEAAPKKSKKKKAGKQAPAPAAEAAVEAEPTPAPEPVPEVKELTPLQKSCQNDLRKQQKKLREVTDLRAKQEAGATLTVGQQAKVANEAELARAVEEAQSALDKANEEAEKKEEEWCAPDPGDELPEVPKVAEEEPVEEEQDDAEEEQEQEEEDEKVEEQEEEQEEDQNEESENESEEGDSENKVASEEKGADSENKAESQEEESSEAESDAAEGDGAIEAEAEDGAEEEEEAEEKEEEAEKPKVTGPPRKGGVITSPPTVREKELMKIRKKIREIEALEQKEAGGATLEPNQRAKMDKKDGLLKDEKEWVDAVEEYTCVVKGEVKEIMTPLVGVKVAIQGHDKLFYLPGALMKPTVTVSKFKEIRDRYREGSKVNVRILRDNDKVCELDLEEEETRAVELEHELGELDAILQDDAQRFEEVKKNYGWTSEFFDAEVSVVKNFGVLAWIWGCREVMVRSEGMLDKYLYCDPSRGEQVPDRYSIQPGTQVKLRLKYLPAKKGLPEKVVGNMRGPDQD